MNSIKEEFVYFIKKENWMFFIAFKPSLKTEEFFQKITVASKLYPNC